MTTAVTRMAFVNAAFRLPKKTVNSTQSISPTRSPVCMAAVTRRDVLRLATLALGTTLLPNVSQSFSLNDLAISGTVETITLGRSKAEQLKKTASSWANCTEDEKSVVLRFIPVWLEPARVASAKLPDLLNGKNIDVDRLRGHGNAMYGHLLELRAEAKAFNTKGIIRELDEIMETADAITDSLHKAGIA